MVGKRRFPRRKYLILFNSYLYTVKSIYRRKMPDGKLLVCLRFNETKEQYRAQVEDVNLVAGIKKGDLVTIHVGNGGYMCIEKGDKMPKDGQIMSCEV